jgi:hypothetical protein
MVDPSGPPKARELIAVAINSYRDGDPRSLATLIAQLDGQRERLEGENKRWLAEYEHHVRVLDEIYALTQQSRWSRFGRRRRRIVNEELRGLRSMLVQRRALD